MCACCHTETEVADQICYLTQSQYADTVPTSPNAEYTRLLARCTIFQVIGMTRPGQQIHGENGNGTQVCHSGGEHDTAVRRPPCSLRVEMAAHGDPCPALQPHFMKRSERPVTVITQFKRSVRPVTVITPFKRSVRSVTVITQFKRSVRPVTVITPFKRSVRPVTVITQFKRSVRPVKVITQFKRSVRSVTVITQFKRSVRPVTVITQFKRSVRPVTVITTFLDSWCNG